MTDFQIGMLVGWVLGGVVGFNINAAITKFLVQDKKDGVEQCIQVEKT